MTLQPVFAELGSLQELPQLQRMITEKPSYARQRAIYRDAGDLVAVVDALVRECEQDKPVLIEEY